MDYSKINFLLSLLHHKITVITGFSYVVFVLGDSFTGNSDNVCQRLKSVVSASHNMRGSLTGVEHSVHQNVETCINTN